MTIEGTDISHWNANPYLGHYEFVFHKATQGDEYVDPMYRDRMQDIKPSGRVWGSYHFFDPRISAADQAVHYSAEAHVEEGDILAVDFEYQIYWRTYDPRHIATEVNSLLTILEDEFPWNRVLLYCNRSDYGNYILPYEVTHADGLWIASPGRIPTMDWVIWQYGAGVMDYDRAIFSTKEDMKRWAGSKGRPYRSSQQALLFKD